MKRSHRIETLSWEATFSHASQAHAEQDRLSQFIHKQALRCLNERFDAISPGDEVWALDRLEINMGRLSLKDSPSQWLRQFDAAVQRSLAALTAPRTSAAHAADQTAGPPATDPTALTPSGQRQSAAAHEMGQFLYYLEHGVLPWGLPLRSARDLAGWLERLARQHGQRLWQGLQQLMPPEPVLARLAQIAPHAGLQALLGVRHHDLADGMLLLDEAWLLPLQRRGRLSAYQVQGLQQQLRVAGLHALWGLSGGALGGTRQRNLLAALRTAHVELLGPGWTSLRRDLQGQALPRQPGSELAAAMLQALLADDHTAVDDHQPGQDQASATGMESPQRITEAALRRLQAQVQAWANGQRPATSVEQISNWFTQLHRHAPAALAQGLRAHLRQRSGRRAWSLALPAHQHWALLALLASPSGSRDSQRSGAQDRQGLPATASSQRPAPPQWADSLRQTALQLVQQCPAGARPGLSDMQALLLEASLAYLLEHGRMPATHSAWQAVWRAAWQELAQPDAGKPNRPKHQAKTHAATAGAARPADENVGQERQRTATPAHVMPDLLQLSWLPALVARWLPPAEPAQNAAATAAPQDARALPAVPAWPAAALRRWLWEQAALCTSQQATPPSPAALQTHWQQAWLALQRSVKEAASALVPAPNTAPMPPASAVEAPSDSRTSPSHAQQQLHALWLQCEQGAWGPTQRLALARLLEQADTCSLWCERFDESQRWRWLQAQFGDVSKALRHCATDLLRQLVQSEQAAPHGAPGSDAPEQAPQPNPATLARHWALLCEHLFVLAGPAEPAALRRHHVAAVRQPVAPKAAKQRSLLPSRRPTMASPITSQQTPPTEVASVPSVLAMPSRLSQRPTPASSQSASSAPIWVDDAGQVLISAYAERLFKHLGLVDAGQFVDARAQARGVLCLQALVRGEEPSSEPFWPLSKLLCGVEPGDVLPACEPLNADEHALLAQLLGAVIAHWKAIGNTSVAGLRESFLQREGRLERQRAEHGEPQPWRLKVQPRAFDMLLDRLPWGFSIIKLPWMQGVLHVEWR
jgi:hypothetical protein